MTVTISHWHKKANKNNTISNIAEIGQLGSLPDLSYFLQIKLKRLPLKKKKNPINAVGALHCHQLLTPCNVATYWILSITGVRKQE